jgi:glycoprotein endo-alpha-1,2-mannosidase
MNKNILLTIFLLLLACNICFSQTKVVPRKYMSYKGLVMAGYQGWFNAEGDGAGRGWNHYKDQRNLFEPGHTKIDMWPDVSEYPIKYKTAFTYTDGNAAYVFSSYDESTVDLHFKWMQDYNIDGVFMQRFVSTLRDTKGNDHMQKVFASAISAAKKYDRAIAVMYDLSGMKADEYTTVIEDWKKLIDKYKLNKKAENENYLFHNEKPLVAIWGVGFNDGRKYGLTEIEKLMDFFKNDPVYGGCSILLGVPTWWRELKFDTKSDSRLHEVIKKASIVQPWFVGRYNEDTYPHFQQRIKDDIAWCKQYKLDYVPVVYPGFSWKNMRPNDPFDAIPRNKGSFFWKQLVGGIEAGGQMLYVAMFDEIDEATAIFKVVKESPIGKSKFVPYEEDIPSDHYLWLTGQASGILKKEVPFQKEIPYRTY